MKEITFNVFTTIGFNSYKFIAEKNGLHFFVSACALLAFCNVRVILFS